MYATARTIAFDRFEERTYWALALIGHLRHQKQVVCIRAFLELVILLSNRVISTSKKFLPEVERWEEYLSLNKQIRDQLRLIIQRLEPLQVENRLLFSNSLIRRLENLEDYFDSQVENLQLVLTPAIQDGIHKAIRDLKGVKDNKEPWRDSLAQM